MVPSVFGEVLVLIVWLRVVNPDEQFAKYRLDSFAVLCLGIVTYQQVRCSSFRNDVKESIHELFLRVHPVDVDHE